MDSRASRALSDKEKIKNLLGEQDQRVQMEALCNISGKNTNKYQQK